jgi:hypothetical protein
MEEVILIFEAVFPPVSCLMRGKASDVRWEQEER